MTKEKTTYELVVKKQRIAVSKEVYRAYYQCRDREVYLERLHRKYTESLEELEECGFSVERNSSFISKETAEDEAIRNIMIEKMKVSLKLLNEDELFLITEIYKKGVSERELAKIMNVSQQVVHYKKNNILNKMKEILKNN